MSAEQPPVTENSTEAGPAVEDQATAWFGDDAEQPTPAPVTVPEEIVETLRHEQSRPVSPGEIDTDLAMYGFNGSDKYPEHGHDALRQAWIAGRDDALVRAFRCLSVAPRPEPVADPLPSEVGTVIRATVGFSDGKGYTDVVELFPGGVWRGPQGAVTSDCIDSWVRLVPEDVLRVEAITDAAVEAAAREQWRQEHGSISSHDSQRTPESDERESAESGYREWDRSVSEAVKEGCRRRARAALTAALPHLRLVPEDDKDTVRVPREMTDALRDEFCGFDMGEGDHCLLDPDHDGPHS